MRRFIYLMVAMFGLSGCAQVQLASHVVKQVSPSSKSQGTFKVGNSYKVAGKWYHPREQYNYSETGIASWYGSDFHGKKTANGETYDMYELTAAHKTLQLPSIVRVTNLDNGRSLIVRVNDRGPYKRGRIIDLSKRSAELLGFKNQGTARVRIDVMPEESRQVAMAAKSGRDTSGYEVALNNNAAGTRAVQHAPVARQQPVQLASAEPVTSVERAALEPVQVASLEPKDIGVKEAVPGHVKSGNFYPDAVVRSVPVQPTQIYIQAGSFSTFESAYQVRGKLENIARAGVYPAEVGGRKLYRVRIGPLASVDQADNLLGRVVNGGYGDAMIVVD